MAYSEGRRFIYATIIKYIQRVSLIMEQPKDFEELLKEEYNSLSIVEKVIYKLQDYVVVAIPASFAIGFIIGIYFGK